MLSALCLVMSVSLCTAAPAVTEDQLRALLVPLLDTTQDSQVTKVSADTPPLFASLAAVAPLNNLAIEPAATQATQPSNIDLASQISPANQQQLGQLNLAGGLTNLVQTALGALRPQETAPTPSIDPIFGSIPQNTYPMPNVGQVRPPPAAARPNNNNNLFSMFNPLSMLFSSMGGGSGSPFGMFMPSLMMRMMEGLMELF